MGKKGAALRAAKENSTTYTFTAAQLEEHDRMIRRLHTERMRSSWKEEVKKELEKAQDIISKDWEDRERIMGGNAEEVTLNVFSMLISISCVVLVRDFGWPPIYNHSTGRQRLARFITSMQREVEKIINDETVDIRKYAEDAYEITGVKLEAEGEEETDE